MVLIFRQSNHIISNFCDKYKNYIVYDRLGVMKVTYEVNTNGTYVTVDVRIILHTKSNRTKKKISESHFKQEKRIESKSSRAHSESKKQAWFSNGGVADQQKLEEVITTKNAQKEETIELKSRGMR